MESFSNVVVIDRPVRQVFGFVSDFENVPRWNYAITRTRKTSPGPVSAGTTYVQRREVPEPGEEQFTVTDLVPDRQVAVEGTLGPFPARLSYEFEPAEGGGTVVTNSVELRITGPLRLLGGIATSRVKKAVADNLGALKRLLETPA
jgi:uncharacterized protein YndB with AHSA1/START domain